MPIFSPLAAVVVLPLALGVLSVLVPQPASASAATDNAAVTFITRRKGISFVEMHQLNRKSLDPTFRDSTATHEACLPSQHALSASLFGDFCQIAHSVTWRRSSGLRRPAARLLPARLVRPPRGRPGAGQRSHRPACASPTSPWPPAPPARTRRSPRHPRTAVSTSRHRDQGLQGSRDAESRHRWGR